MGAADVLSSGMKKSILDLTRFQINRFAILSSRCEDILQAPYRIDTSEIPHAPYFFDNKVEHTHLIEEGSMLYYSKTISIDEACEYLKQSIMHAYECAKDLRNASGNAVVLYRDRLIMLMQQHDVIANHFRAVFEDMYDLHFPVYDRDYLGTIFLLFHVKGPEIYKHIAALDSKEAMVRELAYLSVSKLNKDFDNQWTEAGARERYGMLTSDGLHDDLNRSCHLNWAYLVPSSSCKSGSSFIDFHEDTKFLYCKEVEEVVRKHLKYFDSERGIINASYGKSNPLRAFTVQDVLPLLYLAECCKNAVIYRIYYAPYMFIEWQEEYVELFHSIIIKSIADAYKSLKAITGDEYINEMYFEIWDTAMNTDADIRACMQSTYAPDVYPNVSKTVGYFYLLMESLSDLFDMNVFELIEEMYATSRDRNWEV